MAEETFAPRWEKVAGHWQLLAPDGVPFRMGEILAAGERPKPDNGDYWGPWVYNGENLTLECRPERTMLYYVDLERCRNSAEILDWIAQVAAMGLGTEEVIGHLVHALDDLLKLQANVCGFGQDHQIDPRKILLG